MSQIFKTEIVVVGNPPIYVVTSYWDDGTVKSKQFPTCDAAIQFVSAVLCGGGGPAKAQEPQAG